MEFCQLAEGNSNPAISEATENFQKLKASGMHTVPSLIRDELRYNVFMRCREPNLQQSVGETDPAKCMHILREWKNKGQKPNL